MLATACVLCCGLTIAVTAGILLSGFATLSPTQVALIKNNLFHTVDSKVVTKPGFQYIKPFNVFLKYPKTIQTLHYDAYSPIHGRTSDGLPLTLTLGFQFRLDPEGVYHLYHTYEQNSGDYLKIFRLISTHIITNTANNFSAYQFFSSKQQIAKTMTKTLDKYFREHLHARVLSLQIDEDRLPESFTQKILETAAKKQEIRQTTKFKTAKKIDFQTARIVAKAQASVTIQRAVGRRNHIEQNGRADAAVILYNVDAEMNAYSKIKEQMNLTAEQLLTYIWYDSIGGGNVGAGDSSCEENVSLLLGLKPGAYIAK